MALSAIELMRWVGKSATYRVRDDMFMAVEITDAKESYGSTRVEIVPVSGTGSIWVDTVSITLVSEIRCDVSGNLIDTDSPMRDTLMSILTPPVRS